VLSEASLNDFYRSNDYILQTLFSSDNRQMIFNDCFHSLFLVDLKVEDNIFTGNVKLMDFKAKTMYAFDGPSQTLLYLNDGITKV
jgi:hypothetical protein